MAGRPGVASELTAVTEAAKGRFGADDMARLRRGGRELHAGEENLARVMRTESRGRGAHEPVERVAERQREAERERLGLSRGHGMGM